MMKFKLVVLLTLFTYSGFSQEKLERAHRIKKSQFPEEAHSYIAEHISNSKNLKFYKEIDSNATHFSARFKKGRLKYHINFDPTFKPQFMGFIVKEVDIPEASYAAIIDYLGSSFDSYKIRRIFQEYHMSSFDSEKQLVKDAMQNMILPTNKFRLLLVLKKKGERKKQIGLFDADGSLIWLREALPANYDHVLY